MHLLIASLFVLFVPVVSPVIDSGGRPHPVPDTMDPGSADAPVSKVRCLDATFPSDVDSMGIHDAISSRKTDLIPPLPVYDTDIGFGIVLKGFFLNHLGSQESFDLTLFGSTKGEQWARFVFSMPDFERRQGTEYPLAIDVVIDFDRYIRYIYFGLGNRSRFEDKEEYTREPLEISVSFGRGITTSFSLQAGLKYRSILNLNFSPESRLATTGPEQNHGRSTTASISLSATYDSRDSYINSRRGTFLRVEIEKAPRFSDGFTAFTRFAGWFKWYHPIISPDLVVAMRAGYQHILGTELPVQNLISLGGVSSLRGVPLERYLDKVSALANFECRFPILWRFGGVIGLDAGKVWDEPRRMDLGGWEYGYAAGLRYYADTFVIRADVGFGRETTALYLNFGHMFDAR